MLIGLSGYARSGKDTAARVLVERYGYRRVAFADTLREALLTLDPIVHVDSIGAKRLSAVLSENLHDRLSIAAQWEYAKTRYPEVRTLLQRLGTDVGRNMFGEDFWTGQALHAVNGTNNVVFTDVRFQQEADAIRAFGFGSQVWRIARAGCGPANAHISETALDDYQYFTEYLHNDGSQVEFEELVAERYETAVQIAAIRT